VLQGQPDWTVEPIRDDADWAGAVALIESAMSPAPRDRLEEVLAGMAQAVDRWSGDEVDADLQLSVYVERARQFPADAAIAAINDWPERNRKWPAWADLRSHMERFTRKRLEMLRAIEHDRPKSDGTPVTDLAAHLAKRDARP